MIRRRQDANPTQSPRFRLGRLVITPAALEIAREKGINVSRLIRRHAQCDWGDIGDEDRQANTEALAQGLRVMSVYRTHGITIWVITEADRSVTTLLLPEEY